MKITLKTKKLGRIDFSIPGGGYIYADMGNWRKPGCMGDQVCDGGQLNSGSTLTYQGNGLAGFERVCRRWWAAYLRRERLGR